MAGRAELTAEEKAYQLQQRQAAVAAFRDAYFDACADRMYHDGVWKNEPVPLVPLRPHPAVVDWMILCEQGICSLYSGNAFALLDPLATPAHALAQAGEPTRSPRLRCSLARMCCI